MSSRQLRVGLVSFGAWRFEVFDQAAGGWKIILHPAPGSSASPQTLITDHANGLNELLQKAKTWAMTGAESGGLKASNYIPPRGLPGATASSAESRDSVIRKHGSR